MAHIQEKVRTCERRSGPAEGRMEQNELRNREGMRIHVVMLPGLRVSKNVLNPRKKTLPRFERDTGNQEREA